MSALALNIKHVTLRFGEKTVLSDFSMTLAAGERAVIMGPSGCGKTSILRLAAGLIKPTAGTVTRATGRVAVQFQEPRLLPGRTAAENVNAVLADSTKTMPEARAWLDRVGLGAAADHYPDELSGGMAQRVSLARALAYRGDLLLLDEPFRGLDAALREEMIRLVLTEARTAAILLVTHDPYEAARFSERVITLSADAS